MVLQNVCARFNGPFRPDVLSGFSHNLTHTKTPSPQKAMNHNHAPLPNQILVPFLRPAVADGNAYARPDASPEGECSILPFTRRRHDSNSRILADCRRASLSRLLDSNREAWFLDDDDQDAGANTNAEPAA